MPGSADLFGEGRLIGAVDEFVAHYHRERNHQGLGNRLITLGSRQFSGIHIRCHERLGGMLRYYHRAAWPSDEYFGHYAHDADGGAPAHHDPTGRQDPGCRPGPVDRGGRSRNLLAEQGYYARVVNGQLAL